MEIHTKYVNMPMLELSIGVNSARSIANTLHAMAERGYDYPVDFPRLIQEKRKEWEQIAGMPVASGQYWNSIHGNNADEAAQDLEGLQTMRTLGRNMAFMMKSFQLGKEQIGLPQKEPLIFTNFHR